MLKDQSQTPVVQDDSNLTGMSTSTHALVTRLLADRDRLQRLSSELKDRLKERTAALQDANTRLATELKERKKVEQALRDSNIQLSDALINVTTMQREMIKHARLGALGQMANGIAHDFNNALMPILGLSELMLTCPDLLDNRAELVGALQDIRSAANDAREVVQRLRGFYKTDDSITLASVDINAVISEAMTMTQPRWREELGAAGINIAMHTELADIPPILANAARLREALTNILLNATDAMTESGTITVQSATEEDRVVIRVTDTGIGMSDEVRERCFDPFFSTKGGQGTGIGLVMALGIVQGHNGSIDIESRKNKGTTVTIRLPMLVANTACDGQPSDQDREPVAPLKVLVIDDDARSTDLLYRYLHADDHSVEIANTGRRGIELFSSAPFDLVITDRAMPDMSGDEVSMQLRKAGTAVPVIMLTGFGQIMKDKGEQPPGVNVVLGKPVTPLELRLAIRKVVCNGSGRS